MPENPSTETMVSRLEGLLGTRDLNEWEGSFVLSMKHRRIQRTLTRITDKQIERLKELHDKHFA